VDNVNKFCGHRSYALLCDVTRDSPYDEFQEYGSQNIISISQTEETFLQHYIEIEHDNNLSILHM